MGIFLPAYNLRAAALIAPKADSRYYLCGFLLERREGVLRLIATDGNLMLVQIVTEADNPGPDLSLILPRQFGADLRRPKKSESGLLHLMIDASEDPPLLWGKCNTQEIAGKAIDGRFPDWRRVVPERPSGKPAFYNSALLCTLHQVAAEYLQAPENKARSRFDLHQNGDGPGVVRFSRNEYAIALCMPDRGPDNADPWPSLSYFRGGNP